MAVTGAGKALNVDQGMIEAGRVRVVEVPRYYPVVDAHIHMGATSANYKLAVRAMDAAGIALTVNLSGGRGRELDRHLTLSANYPGRFIQFCSVEIGDGDWDAADLGDRLARSIRDSHQRGAMGLGELGEWFRKDRINWDDPRLDPMWAALEALRMPVNWHVSNPSRYWRPEGVYNTLEAPSAHGKGVLKQELLYQQERVLERHPNLVVIAAHANFLTDELPLLVYRFEKYPNYNVDLSAALEEFGRVPEEFVDIARDYQDRMLYGTDLFYSPNVVAADGGVAGAVAHYKAFQTAHFLFLGTGQRMIPCPFNGNYGRYLVGWERGYTRYAHDGVALPTDILEKIYYRNAERLFKIKAKRWRPSSPVSYKTPPAWQATEKD